MSVSRETEARCARLAALVRRWNPRINLVSKSSLEDLETRHIADSLAVASSVSDVRTWVDLGSGGGFPGLVVSICKPDAQVTLVESDQRKAVFLRRASSELGLNVAVRASRIEEVPPLLPDAISARALAPLDRLLALAVPHGRADTRYVFPKGARYREEIEAARKNWRFDIDVQPSKTDKEAVILVMENIERA
ncbi:16S rRNA (guanine(527)-N(7))-methyltransferase RsmG [Palleronia sp.]|uniref:16S rRNA (guanine(527)-N(7))-methyltransferase RsmG n=1 Tax=Palleronia sp. TaxID=1940284 RepID=UPI0035C84343